MYAQLGNIVFEGLYGFDSFSSWRETALAEHALIDGKPRLQHLGSSLEELSISVYLNAFFCDPEAEIDYIEQARLNGDVMPLITGAGRLLGDFCIKTFTHEVLKTDAQGQIIEARVDLVLLEVYDPDKVAQADADAKAAGFANSANNPVPVPQRPLIQSQSADVMASVNAVNTQSNAINGNVNNALNNASSIGSAFTEALARLQQLQDNLNKVEAAIARAQDLQNQCQLIAGSIGAVRDAAINLGDKINISDLQGVAEANDALQRSNGAMYNGGRQVSNLFATRRI